MARVRRGVIAGEVQLAINRVKEAEALLQKRQHEVAIAKLHLQEAEEHIGWVQEHFRDRRRGQAPILAKLETATTRSFVSSGSSSHASTSANSEEGDPSSYPSRVSNMEANEAEGGGNGKMNGSVVPLTVAALNKLQEQASQGSSK
jgi:hypothetical protein